MYVHHGIHDLIFNFVGTLEASQVGVTLALYFSRYLFTVQCLHITATRFLLRALP